MFQKKKSGNSQEEQFPSWFGTLNDPLSENSLCPHPLSNMNATILTRHEILNTQFMIMNV